MASQQTSGTTPCCQKKDDPGTQTREAPKHDRKEGKQTGLFQHGAVNPKAASLRQKTAGRATNGCNCRAALRAAPIALDPQTHRHDSNATGPAPDKQIPTHAIESLINALLRTARTRERISKLLEASCAAEPARLEPLHEILAKGEHAEPTWALDICLRNESARKPFPTARHPAEATSWIESAPLR